MYLRDMTEEYLYRTFYGPLYPVWLRMTFLSEAGEACLSIFQNYSTQGDAPSHNHDLLQKIFVQSSNL